MTALLILMCWLALWWLFAVVALVLFNLALSRLIEALVPPQGRFIEIDGLRLHIVDDGDKPGQAEPPLVFIHGLMGQLNHFAYALAALFPERRVVLIDRPGSGYSGAAPSQSLKAQGDLVAKIIDALDLRKPLVVGHSLGGAVALALALDHAESIGGLALIAPLTNPVAAAPDLFRGLAKPNRISLWLGAWTLGPIVTLLRSGVTRETAFAPDPMPLAFWNRGGGLLAARPSAPIAAARDIGDQPTELPLMTARYASLAMPVGVLFARQDHVLDAKEQGEVFCTQATGVDLALVDGGHMLPVTQPRASEAFIRKILARVAAP